MTYISIDSALKVLRLALPRSRTIEESMRIQRAIAFLSEKARQIELSKAEKKEGQS